ncbi:hypothetical protein ACK3TF_001804 [Chlorella vulgaris]
MPADDCCVCLEPLAASSDVVSMGCGHLLHQECAAACGRRCPLCRAPIDTGRMRPGDHNPEALTSNGFRDFAPRFTPAVAPAAPAAAHDAHTQFSDYPSAPRRQGPLPSNGSTGLPPVMYGRVEGGPFTFGGGNPYTPISQNEPLTSSIPGNDLAALIDGISSQLGAAAAAPQQAFGEAAAARLPSTWAFCLDVSGSMGSSRAWDPADCSRICFAMVALACVVDSHVAAGDWVHVTAFSSGVETIKPWFCKPVFFHRATFVTQLTAAVRDLGHFRSGTNLCAAALHTLSTLAAKALTLVPPSATRTGADTARGNEAATAAATPACCAAALTVAGSSQRHSLVLLTDGAADDAYELLSAVVEQLGDPPFPDGGFRALLMHIDSRYSSGTLRAMSQDASGAPLPYVELLELELPERLNLSALSGRYAPAGGFSFGDTPTGLSYAASGTNGGPDSSAAVGMMGLALSNFSARSGSAAPRTVRR